MVLLREKHENVKNNDYCNHRIRKHQHPQFFFPFVNAIKICSFSIFLILSTILFIIQPIDEALGFIPVGVGFPFSARTACTRTVPLPFHSIFTVKATRSSPFDETRYKCPSCRFLKSAITVLNAKASNAMSVDHDSSLNTISADGLYFDIEVAGREIGRLVFNLSNPSPLPLHAENIVQLAKGSRRSIDPLAHYVNCQFDYSPASIEEGPAGRYRWGHQLKGRGRNALPGARADEPIHDPKNQLRTTHSCFGGQYYGDRYVPPDIEDGNEDDPGVLLTVPIAGPGRGTSKFSIVRVGESPMEWGERLLMNSGVIGRLDPSSLPVLHAMARQRQGPPTVMACGVFKNNDHDDNNEDNNHDE